MRRQIVFLLFATASLTRAQTSFDGQTSSSLRNYQPITSSQRTEWFAVQTVGPASLAGGAISAGFGTLLDRPAEYGTHWEGFGKRYGMRLTGVSVGNAMEAGLGAVWGEDPRYFRSSSETFGGRLRHVLKMTFYAPNRRGSLAPAYARYAAITGNNFISNAWRADSEATLGNATLRIGLGFLGRMSSNAFQEFWPDVRARFFSKRPPAVSRTEAGTKNLPTLQN